MSIMTDKSIILSISQILQKKSKNINTFESRLLLHKGLIIEKDLKNKKKSIKYDKNHQVPFSFDNYQSLTNTSSLKNSNPETSLQLSELSITDNILLEHIEILKNQLELAGIKPIEDIITYPNAKQKLKYALISASELDSYENLLEVERWDSFVTNHPQFIIEKETEEKEWKTVQNDSIIESLNIQRKIIPEDIANLSILDLQTRNISKKLSTRIFRNKSLWLVHLSKDDISKLHFADLQYKFSNIGLDLIEMKALYACLPEKFLFDHNNKKEKWKKNIIARLKELTNQDDNKTLPQKYMRNYCYLETIESTPKHRYIDLKFRPNTKDLFAELKSNFK